MLLLSIKSSLASPVAGGSALSMGLVIDQGVWICDLVQAYIEIPHHPTSLSIIQGDRTHELLAIESLYLFEGYRHYISFSCSALTLPCFRHFPLQLCTLDLVSCNSYFRVIKDVFMQKQHKKAVVSGQPT